MRIAFANGAAFVALDFKRCPLGREAIDLQVGPCSPKEFPYINSYKAMPKKGKPQLRIVPDAPDTPE